MDACMGVCAAALAAALEHFDLSFLGARRPHGAKVHDVRERTLLCECGQVTFRRRRFELVDGTRFCALDEALGLIPGSRVSPGAFAMVRDDALAGSYARAAELLCRHTRTSLSRSAVGSILREAAEALKTADSEAARDLFELGLASDANGKAEVLCVEADGTWPALQRDPMGRAEVKAMVAYAGKEEAGSGRRRRIGPVVHYAAVSGPEPFWKRGVARVGSFYDLSALEAVHLGTDGEGWCKGGGAYFPTSAEVIGHLDPRHLFAAIRLMTMQAMYVSYVQRGASMRRLLYSPSSQTRRARSPSLCPTSPITLRLSGFQGLPSARWRATTPPSTKRGSAGRGRGRAKACRLRHLCSRHKRRVWRCRVVPQPKRHRAAAGSLPPWARGLPFRLGRW